VLLRGSDPTHYILVVLPLFVLVAARGAEQLGKLVLAIGQHIQPSLTQKAQLASGLFLALALIPAACLAFSFYRGALQTLEESYRESEADRAALKALDLEGHKVACRNMVWFVDADVQTIMLPYGSVRELAYYCRKARIDGLLIWEKKGKHQAFYYNFPYWTEKQFDHAINQSKLFGTPRLSGRWHWYPVHQRSFVRAGS
jgi:hypothetical protein